MALFGCLVHLNAYKSACEEDPNLKLYDSELQERTSKAIVKFADASRKESLSPYAVHKEFSEHLLGVTDGVTKFITEADCDVWESKALKDLVMAYFDSTKKILDIFHTIENCVKNAEMGQLYIQEAVEQFEKEDHAGGKKNKYEKTLKYLNKFKAMGDSFNYQLLTSQFDLINKQQESLMKAVSEAKEKIEKGIASVEHAKFISNVVFGAVVAIAAVASIILIATGVGGAFAAAGTLATQLLSAGWGCVYTALESNKNALEKQLQGLQKLRLKDIQTSVEKGIITNKIAAENVCNEVQELETQIQNMLKLVDEAVEDPDEVAKNFLQKISEKAKEVIEEIKELGESVKKHRKLIIEARTQVMEKITQKPRNNVRDNVKMLCM